MNYFTTLTTLDELKSAYRALCKTQHHDKGGSVQTMQDVNNAYESAVKRLLSKRPDADYGEGKFYATRCEESAVEAAVQAAIQAIAHLDGLDVEIIGAWVWVGGETKTYKEELKAAGYRWMSKRLKWAFMGKQSSGRGKESLDTIRERYGSERVYTNTRRLSV